ncbi:MAG: hypothetical protein U0746_09745 [Gemmataceae bacterium]
MTLTKIQLKVLKSYERHHADWLTISGIIRTCLPSWLLLLVGAAVGFWAMAAVGVPEAGWLVVGMCVGAFVRDVGRCRVLFRTWPVLREVIRWERVRELIQTHDNAA